MRVFQEIAACIGWTNLFVFVVVFYTPVYFLTVFLALKKRPEPVIGGLLAVAKLFATIYTCFSLWPVMWWDKPSEGVEWGVMFAASHNTNTMMFFSAMLIVGVVCFILNCHTFIKQNRLRTA